jgi:hypothetical protein
MSAHGPGAPAAVPNAPFDGGHSLMLGAGALGLLFLLLTLAGGFVAPREALFAYLFSFSYWCGIAVCFLLLLMIFHASNARWPTAFRRAIETGAVSVGVFAVLFIPIALGMKQLFSWVDPHSLPHEEALLVERKHAYLNPTAFVVRAFLYFAIWIVVSSLLRRWSLLQDQQGTAALMLKQRRLGAGALPLVALAITFASFDWLQSLDPIYASTIWGLYYFAGSFVGALATLIIALRLMRERGLLGQAVSVEHFHSLGMFLFGMTCFWAYMAYSQGMLNWIANLPHETRFYLARSRYGFAEIGVLLIVGHFIIPFFVMLSRPLKRRPVALSFMAAWMLLFHALDLYWVVMPALHKGSAAPHWTVFTSFVGVGCVAVAFAVFRARGRPLLPLGDPYLEQSLRYEQP